MIIKAFGIKNPNSVCLEDGGVEGWYYMTDKVRDYMKKFPKGTDVEVTVEQKEKGKIITFFKPPTNNGGNSTGGSMSEPSMSSPSTPTPAPYVAKTYGKSPEENHSIKAQAIMHAVSRTIIGLDGVDLNNVNSVIDTLYNKYSEKVEEYCKSL